MKKQWLFCLLAGAITFIVYMLSLCPSIYPGDSPEFITAAYTLGSAHPPGYPLYCILGKLFSFLPFGSIAYRVNALSCFFGVAAIMLLYLIMLKVTGNYLLSFCFSLAGAFSRVFWSQSVMAEVYTLNAFFMFLTYYILLLWGENREDSYLFLLAFIFGLGMSNHYLLALALPVYVLFIRLNRGKKEEGNPDNAKPYSGALRTGFTLLLFFLLGVSIYFYLIIRSTANPPLDWGNPETVSGFIRHLMRLQYRAFETAKSVGLDTKLLFAGDFFNKVIRQFPLFTWFAGLPGLVWLFKRQRKVFITSLLIFLLNGFSAVLMLQFGFNPVYRGVVEVYYLPAYLISALWICCGFMYFIELIKDKVIFKKVVLFAALCVPLVSLAGNFYRNNLSRHYFMYDFGRNMLKNLEKDAFLNLAADDGVVFPMLYLKHVEKLRPDVSMRDPYGLLFNDVYDKNSGKPVYHAVLMNRDKDKKHLGFVYKVMGEGCEPDSEPVWWRGYEKRGLEDDSIYKDFWTRGITARYPFTLGLFYFGKGMKERGKQEFDRAFDIAHDIPWLLQNIGYVYFEEGLIEAALKAYGRLVEIDRSNSAGYRGLISCHKEMGNRDEVINSYRKLSGVEPDNAELNSVLASLYTEQGDVEQAIRNYRLALDKKPDYVEVYNNLGNIYQGKGDFEESAGLFREAIKIDPDYLGAHYNLAIGYLDKDWDKAISEFREVERINPDYSEVHYQLGYAYDKKGRIEEAIREYKKELSLNPAHLSAHKNIGILYFKKGKHRETVEHWEEYLKFSPDAPDAGLVRKEIEKIK